MITIKELKELKKKKNCLYLVINNALNMKRSVLKYTGIRKGKNMIV